MEYRVALGLAALAMPSAQIVIGKRQRTLIFTAKRFD